MPSLKPQASSLGGFLALALALALPAAAGESPRPTRPAPPTRPAQPTASATATPSATPDFVYGLSKDQTLYGEQAWYRPVETRTKLGQPVLSQRCRTRSRLRVIGSESEVVSDETFVIEPKGREVLGYTVTIHDVGGKLETLLARGEHQGQPVLFVDQKRNGQSIIRGEQYTMPADTHLPGELTFIDRWFVEHPEAQAHTFRLLVVAQGLLQVHELEARPDGAEELAVAGQQLAARRYEISSGIYEEPPPTGKPKPTGKPGPTGRPKPPKPPKPTAPPAPPPLRARQRLWFDATTSRMLRAESYSLQAGENPRLTELSAGAGALPTTPLIVVGEDPPARPPVWPLGRELVFEGRTGSEPTTRVTFVLEQLKGGSDGAAWRLRQQVSRRVPREVATLSGGIDLGRDEESETLLDAHWQPLSYRLQGLAKLPKEGGGGEVRAYERRATFPAARGLGLGRIESAHVLKRDEAKPQELQQTCPVEGRLFLLDEEHLGGWAVLAGQLPLEVGRTCSLGVYRPMRMQAGLVHCYVMERTALPEELAAAAARGEKPKARYFKIAAAEAAGSGLVPLGTLYVAADGRLVGFDVPGPGGTAETFRLAAAPEKKP